MHYLYIKSRGNPYMAINLIKSLTNEKYLKIEEDTAIISFKLLIMIDNEEMLEVEAPLCRT